MSPAAALAIDARGPAEAAPWCAWFTGRDGSYDCAYYTLDQCRFTIRGVPSAGKYAIEVSSKDYAPARLEIPAPRGGATVAGLEIRLEKGNVLRAKLKWGER